MTEVLTVEELGYDPDEVDKARHRLWEWVGMFRQLDVERGWEIEDWVYGLSLRDPRLIALAATDVEVTIGGLVKDDQAIGGYVGGWKTTDAQHAAIEAWRPGDEAAMNAWLDGFVSEAVNRS